MSNPMHDEFGIDVYGYEPLLSRDEIERFGVNALDDLLLITDHILPIADRMDCVIVAVAHDEFKNNPFLMWGSGPRPRKPCKGLKKALPKKNHKTAKFKLIKEEQYLYIYIGIHDSMGIKTMYLFSYLLF
jgi:hypothetical protein